MGTVTEADWYARVNRAMDLILARPEARLDLHEVAAAVHASPYHFHRVFRQLVGETLHAFQKRVRLERALHLMAHAPERNLTDIALDCGFGSSSSFSKAFRERYGLSPRAFDLEAWRAERREELVEGDPLGRARLGRLPKNHNPDGFTATLRVLPERHFAYRRVSEPFKPGRVTDAATELVSWAESKGLAEGAWFGWMFEDPDLVPLSQCRYDVAVQVPAGLAPDGAVGILSMPAMQIAEVGIAGGIELEQRCLDWLYGTWLPTSGYEPAPHPCFEAWVGRPFAHGLEHFELSVQLPIA